MELYLLALTQKTLRLHHFEYFGNEFEIDEHKWNLIFIIEILRFIEEKAC